MKKAVSFLLAIVFVSVLLSGCGAFMTVFNDMPSQYINNKFRLDGSVLLDVFVNDRIVNTRVFPTDIKSSGNLNDYVKAKPIADVIGAEFTADEQSNILKFESGKYANAEYPLEGNAKTIKGDLYVKFSLIETLTEGSMKQEGHRAIFLYTGDYERSDLPKTLEECYIMLDEYLTKEEISIVKNMTEEELEREYYGLGIWIRNTWIYPNHSKIPALFEEYGIWSSDRIAKTILEGYYKYLNGLPCSLEDLMNE